jgi:hypothetical protein
VQTQTAIAPTPLTLRSGHVECPAALIEYTSCWHGVVNNKIVDLGIKNQPAAPALEVALSQLDQQPISRDTYLLLAGRGFFFIQSVAGTKVTLSSDGNRVSITFDLATRQWSAFVTQPTPTLEVGLSAVYGGQKNSRDALMSTCWQGYVNGAATIVYAGRAGIEWGSGNEEPYALLHLGIDLQRTDPAKVKQARTYSSDAPINIGTLGIISV